ncbi:MULTISPECIES: hypothetical protein [Shewanella]|uniref:Uncharacterized protein n=1 Tax=Shewanella submarina TaxID=2016376 RepID=A0ABV7GDD4_9GAMM|nr:MULTISPECIES: hypothetical protein [Shewanella]
MDSSILYLRWLSYVAVIAVFVGIMFATFGEAIVLIMENVGK